MTADTCDGVVRHWLALPDEACRVGGVDLDALRGAIGSGRLSVWNLAAAAPQLLPADTAREWLRQRNSDSSYGLRHVKAEDVLALASEIKAARDAAQAERDEWCSIVDAARILERSHFEVLQQAAAGTLQAWGVAEPPFVRIGDNLGELVRGQGVPMPADCIPRYMEHQRVVFMAEGTRRVEVCGYRQQSGVYFKRADIQAMAPAKAIPVLSPAQPSNLDKIAARIRELDKPQPSMQWAALLADEVIGPLADAERIKVADSLRSRMRPYQLLSRPTGTGKGKAARRKPT